MKSTSSSSPHREADLSAETIGRGVGWSRRRLMSRWGWLSAAALVLLPTSRPWAQMQKFIEDWTGTGTPKRLVIVFADVSGSIPPEDWAIYAETYKNRVTSLKGGDRLILAKIAEDSLGSFAPAIDRTLADTGKLKHDRTDHEKAQVEINDAFEKLRSAPPAKATLILDALTLAQQLIEQDQQRRPQIIILSDMLEYSHIANFEKVSVNAKESDRLIERQKKQGLLPNLHGANVFVAGAKAPKSDKFAEVQAFWLRYFKEAGAVCAPGMYGRPALSFTAR